MILADKIIDERKKNGWSQEELAEKLGVSRQAVSKWEGAQSTPDLQRIMDMSRIFGVSTDYLLKDDLVGVNTDSAPDYGADAPRYVVSMEEAQRFLRLRQDCAPRIALGVFLIILGAALLVLLGALSEYGVLPVDENVAGGVGMTLLLLCIAAAVVLFIRCGQRLKAFAFWEEEEFETAYGVRGLLQERKAQYDEKYGPYIIVGVVLCILAVTPLLLSAAFSKSELVHSLMVCLLLLLIGLGTVLFILSGMNRGAVEILLQEGDYSRQRKAIARRTAAVRGGYWLLATAAYLAWSFITDGWDRTWILWPVAGVLFPVVLLLAEALVKNGSER